MYKYTHTYIHIHTYIYIHTCLSTGNNRQTRRLTLQRIKRVRFITEDRSRGGNYNGWKRVFIDTTDVVV
jgi:hypothetical protein